MRMVAAHVSLTILGCILVGASFSVPVVIGLVLVQVAPALAYKLR